MSSPALEIRHRRNRDAGFTLVELLVVVIVIGILAAIAVPIYLGAQSSAKDSNAKSDLVNAKTAVLVVYGVNKAWTRISAVAADNAATAPVSNAGGFGDSGWASTTAVDDSLTTGGTIDSWCIREASGSGAVFYVTPSDAPTTRKPSAFCS